MELIANLQRNFNRASEGVGPRNLLELSALLERPQPGPEVAEQCRLWADHLETIQGEEAARWGSTRGQLRLLWAEQSSIYQDLVEVLREANHAVSDQDPALDLVIQDFRQLLEEFADSLQAMHELQSSQQPRCPACAWDGNQACCPHCRLHLLVPVRQPHNPGAPVQLQAHHQEVYHQVVAVLMGQQDLVELAEPLGSLRIDFEQASLDAQAHLHSHPAMEAVGEILQVALEGLEEMERVFEDCDSQHLEDGWNAFYFSQLSLVELLTQSELELSRE